MTHDEDDITNGKTWSEDLQCYWSSITALSNLMMEIRVPMHNKVHGAGLIAFAERLMPDVREIIIFEGNLRVRIYGHFDGHWYRTGYRESRDGDLITIARGTL